MSQNDDVVGRLREAVESVALTQKDMGGDIAELAMAVTELSQTAEQLSNALSSVEELKRAVEQVGDGLTAATSKLAELFDAHRESVAQIGRFISDASKQQSGIRQVDERVRRLEREAEERKERGAVGG